MAQSWLEKISYVSLTEASLAVAGAVVHDYMRTRFAGPAVAPSIIGSRISLPGLDWARRRATVVLVLSTACHFCTESAPFRPSR